MAIKLVECFDWPAVNKPGELLRISEQLKGEGVNLDALWAYTSQTNETKIAAIGKRPDKLRAALKKLGVDAKSSHCFYLMGADKAGALLNVFHALTDARINIDTLDAMVAGGHYAATLWVAEADLERARKVLRVK